MEEGNSVISAVPSLRRYTPTSKNPRRGPVFGRGGSQSWRKEPRDDWGTRAGVWDGGGLVSVDESEDGWMSWAGSSVLETAGRNWGRVEG
jgi:hypothetical protein